MLNELDASVAEVMKEAEAFYTLSGSNLQAMALATSLKVKLKTLFDLIDALERSGLRLDAEEELKRFRQAVTGGQFESSNRVAIAAGAPILQNISAAGSQLSRVARLAYFESFVVKAQRSKSE